MIDFSKLIIFPKYAADVSCIPVTKENLSPYKDFIVARNEMPNAYNLLWGQNFETGFFWEAAHIDTLGIYQHSSFNTVKGIEAVENFDRPSVLDKLLNSKIPSKYRQVNFNVDWDGVVLACQNPIDRSVLSTGGRDSWWKFYEEACKFYGKNLYVKLHPWNSGEVGEKICKMARKYDCQYGKTNHSVIKKCQFVIMYNSTFCVDCFIRGVPVAQFAPGYFHKTPAITFTDGKYPTDIRESDEWGKKLVNFLAHKYCFNVQMTVDKWVKMMRHFSVSKELFPMKDEFSYIYNMNKD